MRRLVGLINKSVRNSGFINKFMEEAQRVFVKDRTSESFGDLPLICSTAHGTSRLTPFAALSEQSVSQKVTVRARLQTYTARGNLAFVVLRQGQHTLQAAAFKSDAISKEMLAFICGVSRESIVEIEATVVQPKAEIKRCSIQNLELQVERFFVVSRSLNVLPFQLEDASRPEPAEGASEEEKQATVALKTRLDSRVLDLRTPANQAIFRLQSAVCRFFRDFLHQRGFIEIHTPKLLGGTSEGGANVFRLDYFNRPACLAQSPQLYKQMMVMADFPGVFEIGPVFRAEQSFTHRHLTEFTGLDIEMPIEQSYFEVLELIGALFPAIFAGLEREHGPQLRAVAEQHPYEPFLFAEKTVILTFKEGVEMLNAAGTAQAADDDLSTETERVLGRLVREKYATDFYILHRYPASARPFYVMPCSDDPTYTCSYDVFMRGEEILSGGQRIHDAQMLSDNATKKGIPLATISDYVDSFKYGAYPHAGMGAGLERVLMLYLNLGNIRKTSAFPRDPNRISP